MKQNAPKPRPWPTAPALLFLLLVSACGGPTVPEEQDPPPSAQGVTAIAVGTASSVALMEDGSVYTWGNNSSGELGDGSKDGTLRREPTKIDGLSDVVAVAAAPLQNSDFGRHVLALTANGNVYAWGYNGNGQVGNGGNAPVLVPVLVSFE